MSDSVTFTCDSDADIALAALAKALGHPTRVRILRYLLQQRSCTCAPIVDVIGGAQSTVSQHLKILKNAGLIQGAISGKNTCYCLNPAAFTQLGLAVQPFTGQSANEGNEP
jgi:ArsR family transcriptional regulator